MISRYEVYKCEHCGNIVETLVGGGGDLSCCGHPMVRLDPGVTDAAQEKHVPVIEKIPGGYKVRVGSVAHPMEAKHWIVWIELVADGISYTKFLQPGDAPEATFNIDNATNVTAREYCNLHGHWSAKA